MTERGATAVARLARWVARHRDNPALRTFDRLAQRDHLAFDGLADATNSTLNAFAPGAGDSKASFQHDATSSVHSSLIEYPHPESAESIEVAGGFPRAQLPRGGQRRSDLVDLVSA